MLQFFAKIDDFFWLHQFLVAQFLLGNIKNFDSIFECEELRRKSFTLKAFNDYLGNSSHKRM